MRGKILDLLEQEDDFISGEVMSEALGVTRAAIWKHIKLLIEAGYEIDSIRNKGYRLKSIKDCIESYCVEPLINTDKIGKNYIYKESIDSTNNYLKRCTLSDRPMPHGTVVVANEQTAGKGRRGRVWTSPRGQGIFMSVLVKVEVDTQKISQLTLVAGLAVQQALHALYGMDLQIKWPNDIIYHGKKVCGILTEMSGEIGEKPELIVGIGINANQFMFNEELKHKAISLRMIMEMPIDRARVIACVLYHFESLLKHYLNNGLVELMESFNRVCANVNVVQKAVSIEGSIEGVGIGINNQGELLIQTQKAIVPISSGEVSIEGIYQ